MMSLNSPWMGDHFTFLEHKEDSGAGPKEEGTCFIKKEVYLTTGY